MADDDSRRLRTAIQVKYPYLGFAAFTRPIRSTDKVPLCGMSKGGVFYYNPETFGEENLGVKADLFTSALWSVLRDHAKRRSYRNPETWGIASQSETNQATSLPPDRFIQPKKRNLPAEDYYEDPPYSEGKESQSGSSMDGLQREWEEADGEMSEAEKEAFKRQVAEEIMKNRGTVPEGALLWAEELLSPKVNWEFIFRNVAQSILSPLSNRRSFSRPFRRESEFIYPGKIGRIPKIGILLDTSGSMMGEGISMALGAVSEICREIGSVEVMDCDAEIHDHRRVTGEVHSYHGGGGTSMRKGIEKIDGKYDLIIVLTDGETDWPKESRTPLVTVLPMNRVSSVPDFIKAVGVEEWR